MKVAVVKETAPGERRVALVPEAVTKLRSAGHEVLVQTGAGAGAFLPDESYSEAGASVVPADQLAEADAVLFVGRPDGDQIARLRPGQAVLGMFAPLTDPELAARLAATGATAVSLDLLPRKLSRTQPMDALSSQANIAGY
jgi:NAD(P) transhydrogenase subunit alpha